MKSARPTSTENAPTIRVLIPELRALQATRYALARGGTPPVGERTPEDCARISSFHVVSLLLRILMRFKQKIEAGERCRLVEREHVFQLDRVVIEVSIDPTDTGTREPAPLEGSPER